jgi:hypothetical protein
MLKRYKEGDRVILKCDLCEKELIIGVINEGKGPIIDTEKAREEGWLIILTPLGEIVEVYCSICRVIICPKGNCND